MHDILLAQQIFSKLKEIKKAKNLLKIKKVNLEIGRVSMAHYGHEKHEEDINPEKLALNLKDIAKDTDFSDTEYKIKKVEKDFWRIVEVET